MLEEVDEEVPLSEGPPPASPSETAVGVTLLLDRATSLVDQIRSSSPFATPGNPSRAGTASPTSSSSSQLHPPLGSAANAFLPSSLTALPTLTKVTSAQRSLTVSTADEVYSLQFSPDLESLSIDNCNLSSLPLQLASCTALRYLRLRENLLDDLPSWLGNLTALKQLDLVGNRLRTIPPDLPKKLTNLTSLALSENAKSARNAFSFTLPFVAPLVRLADISLGALNLPSFPLSLLDLPSLRTLNLSDNRITVVPEAISRLTSLHALFLSMNPIADLPQGLARLTSLLRLHLHRCIFEHFPQSITALCGLETLHLDHNLISALPASVSTLTSLSYLSLSNNHVSVLPDSLLQLTKLRTLLLDHTDVQSLPAVVRLPELTLVSMRQTPFHYVTIELLPFVDKIVWESKPVYAEPCWGFLPHSLVRLQATPARISSLKHLAATQMLRRMKLDALPSFMESETARTCVECRSLYFGEGFAASSLWPYRHFSAASSMSNNSLLPPSMPGLPASNTRFLPVLHVACSVACLAKSVNLAAKMIVQFKAPAPSSGVVTPKAPATQEQCTVS